METVVLAVHDLETARDRFKTAFDLDSPSREHLDHFDADATVFADTPVVLVTPNGDSWLTNRLERFGPRPVAYLLGIDPDSKASLNIVETESFAGRTLDWVRPTEPIGRPYLGILTDQ